MRLSKRLLFRDQKRRNMNTQSRGRGFLKFFMIVCMLAAMMACQVSFGAPTEEPQEPIIVEVVVTATAEAEAPAPIIAEEPAPTPEPPAPEYLPAGEPGATQITLKDVDGSLLAYDRGVSSGDYFLEGRYERPFTSVQMDYLPDVDIQTATIAADNDFYYFTITLKDFDPAENRLTGSYGIEIDRGLKGRGDFLVFGRDFGEEWSTQNLAAYIDQNRDVGGLNPWIANEGHTGDGYETALEFADDKVAYARLAPGGVPAVQFAVSRALLNGAYEFLYGAVADRGWQNPGRFEYNDFIGPTAAGSPILLAVNYPVRDLFGLDNTCRRAYGFAPVGTIRGMCTSKPITEPEKECQKVCYNFGQQTICYRICE
jgi:hypothetical protein